MRERLRTAAIYLGCLALFKVMKRLLTATLPHVVASTGQVLASDINGIIDVVNTINSAATDSSITSSGGGNETVGATLHVTGELTANTDLKTNTIRDNVNGNVAVDLSAGNGNAKFPVGITLAAGSFSRMKVWSGNASARNYIAWCIKT